MAVLKDSGFRGRVEWLGVAAPDGLRSTPCDALELGFGGIAGARHEGVNRPSCVRVKDLYPRGTEIRNVRQLTVLCAAQMAEIAEGIDLAALDPALLGANLVLRGIPDFTHVPPSARLQGPSGATLTLDMENLPCVLPGREIEAETPGHGKAFKVAAVGKRGVTAWVERPGAIALGDELTLFVPAQRPWRPA
ncbi:MAG: MOSC domain-containing protein [Rhodobacteraceae bacterium]|nr:MOSC domain-containing protein [Paracoccaceae bacterium]